MSAPGIAGFSVKGYKAFARRADVELGRLTFVLGKNNAGKSALCHAPLFFSYPLDPQAAPFPLTTRGIDFCSSLLGACYGRQPSGLWGELRFEDGGSFAIGGSSVSEQNQRQVITSLAIKGGAKEAAITSVTEWAEARRHLEAQPQLAAIPQRLTALTALRPAVARSYRYQGSAPEGIGPSGEEAFHYLAYAKADGRAEVFQRVNRWFERLGVHIGIDLDPRGDSFEVTASRPGGPKVNLVDVGAGIAQLLPLVVAFEVVPPEAQPMLAILEQPEMDLHPFAHTLVAELLIEAVENNPQLKLLVETHSDALVLRARREVAAQRLGPVDVRLYFIEEDSEVTGGSVVKESALDDRGTPSYWPKGVFAESQAEFAAIRRELAKRDGGR